MLKVTEGAAEGGGVCLQRGLEPQPVWSRLLSQ